MVVLCTTQKVNLIVSVLVTMDKCVRCDHPRNVHMLSSGHCTVCYDCDHFVASEIIFGGASDLGDSKATG